MTKVSEHLAFFDLVATTTTKQAYALVKTATPEQVDAVGELFENVLRATIVLTGKALTLFRRRKSLVRALATRQTPSATRQRLVHRSYRVVRLLLQHVPENSFGALREI